MGSGLKRATHAATGRTWTVHLFGREGYTLCGRARRDGIECLPEGDRLSPYERCCETCSRAHDNAAEAGRLPVQP